MFGCKVISEVGSGITALAALISILTQLPSRGPHCYVQELYVPALDLTAAPEIISNSTNPFLFFDLSLRNIVPTRGISYGDVNLTFYYGHKAVASYTVPGFYQGWKRTALRRDVVETSGVPWQDAVNAVSAGTTAGFRIELAAQPRFKFLFWNSKEKKVRVAADVAVDGTGMKAVRDHIRLNSAYLERGITSISVFFPCLVITTYLII